MSPRCPSDICGGVWWALGSEAPARDANVGDILLPAFETVCRGEERGTKDLTLGTRPWRAGPGEEANT